MTSEKPPVTIKKYANRRLYNTGTSAYVTLEDLASMVKRGDDFVVYDAKGDSMQMMVPSYLERSLDKLTKAKGGFADGFGKSLPTGAMMNNPMAGAAAPMFAQMEELSRQNVAMFRKALSMFTPAVGAMGTAAPKPPEPAAEPTSAEGMPTATAQASGSRTELDDMRRQLGEMQRRIEGMTPQS